MKKTFFPTCKEMKLKTTKGIVWNKDFHKLTNKMGEEWSNKFNECFGIQTCPEGGMWAHDVEAVLVRMKTGKLTGSQLIWD